MNQFRMIVRVSDVALIALVIVVTALGIQHYVRFKEFIFPQEGALFLIPWPVLQAIAVKEKKKCEAREAFGTNR